METIYNIYKYFMKYLTSDELEESNIVSDESIKEEIIKSSEPVKQSDDK